jgi:hypothetical protein
MCVGSRDSSDLAPLTIPPPTLLDYEYDNGRLSRGDTGYAHGFCDAGTDPYKPYGMLEHVGEKCCYWDAETSTIAVGKFVPIECSEGWFCMTYCEYVPAVGWEPSPGP